MPTLYIYFGLKIIFHSREHEPIHVHGKVGLKECKAEIIFSNGEIVSVKYKKSGAREPLTGKDLKKFKALVENFKEDITEKWINYFIKNIQVETMIITEEI